MTQAARCCVTHLSPPVQHAGRLPPVRGPQPTFVQQPANRYPQLLRVFLQRSQGVDTSPHQKSIWPELLQGVTVQSEDLLPPGTVVPVVQEQKGCQSIRQT